MLCSISAAVQGCPRSRRSTPHRGGGTDKELSPIESRGLSWFLLSRAEGVPGLENSLLSGIEVERKKDPFKNSKTPRPLYVKKALGLESGACRASGNFGNHPVGPVKPLQIEAGGWQDRVSTGKDQKQWKGPEYKWGGLSGDHCRIPGKRWQQPT